MRVKNPADWTRLRITEGPLYAGQGIIKYEYNPLNPEQLIITFDGQGEEQNDEVNIYYFLRHTRTLHFLELETSYTRSDGYCTAKMHTIYPTQLMIIFLFFTRKC